MLSRNDMTVLMQQVERGGDRESVTVDAVAATDTVSQRRVAMEVAGLAVWCAA